MRIFEWFKSLYQSIVEFFTTLAAAYTWKFMIVLLVINFCCKGILYIVAVNSMMPMFKAQGVSASELQMLAALSMSPWAMKPLFGVLSDVVAIAKYHKRYWMLIGCGAGVFGVFMLIVQLKVVSVTVLFFLLMHLEMIILDLLSEGKYAEIMRDTKGGSEIVT